MIYGVQCMPGSQIAPGGGGEEIFVVDFENDTYSLGGVAKTAADVLDITSYIGGGKFELLENDTPPQFIDDYLAALVDLSAGWSIVVDLFFYTGKTPGRDIIGMVDGDELFDHYVEFKVDVGNLRGEQGDTSDNLFASISAPTNTRARVGMTLASSEVTVAKQGGSPVTETFATVLPLCAKAWIGTSFTGDTMIADYTPITLYSIKLYDRLSPSDLQTAVDTGALP